MCGIAGCFGPQASEELALDMANKLTKRGPDDVGVFFDKSRDIALSHRRLAILDLSAEGHQPMVSPDGRFEIVFNGEIYNHLELRKELEKEVGEITWRGHSDTETLLFCVQRWGLRETVSRALGMFAIALWDRETEGLFLVRDRLGEKPLYYGWSNGLFLFASELKAFQAFPAFTKEIDRDTLALYFKFSNVPAPYSIYESVFKLEPGCILSLNKTCNSCAPVQYPSAPLELDGFSIEKYWSISEIARNGQSKQIRDESRAIKLLEASLKEAISRQAIADVPLGAFLSGGIDSSTVVALLQCDSQTATKTFSIGFDQASLDEARYAKAVAQHLKTEHTELYVSSSDAQNVIPIIPELYCEPFADPSQIPTYLVSKLARDSVTVALSGDGGDELFCGYNRYLWGSRVWKKINLIPRGLRPAIGEFINLIPKTAWSQLSGLISVSRLSDKASKMAIRLQTVSSEDDLYRSLVSEWDGSEGLVINNEVDLPTNIDNDELVDGLEDPENRMMVWDSLSYLPDDILHKVDRAAMGVSLETRVPFLDPKVVELAWQLPLGLKLKEGETKWILRQVLYKHVPKRLIERPKAGFAMPTGEWLKGPLKAWAEELLSEERLAKDGYLSVPLVRKKFHQHISGERDWTNALWSILMFQAWLDHNK